MKQLSKVSHVSGTFALVALLAVTVSAGVACKDKDSPAPSAAPAPAASFAPVTAEALPSRAAEEEKANTEITAENYKSQLDQIEKDIGQ